MNNLEAEICLQMQIPVRIIKPVNDYQKEQRYQIVSLHKCKDYHLEKQYIRTAGLSPAGWERTSTTEDIDNIEVLPEFKEFLFNCYQRQRRNAIQRFVREMLDDGENKTTLGKQLKQMIDEIRSKS